MTRCEFCNEPLKGIVVAWRGDLFCDLQCVYREVEQESEEVNIDELE